MSDTPTTDQEESSYDYRIIPHERHYSVDAEYARKLEVALRRAVRFVDAFEPKSRGAEVNQRETLALAKVALSNIRVSGHHPAAGQPQKQTANG